MPSVMQVIQRLLPYGTREPRPALPHHVEWLDPPTWPPDLFAVAATLVELSGCYAHHGVPATGRSWHVKARRLGEVWARSDPADAAGLRQLSSELGRLWSALLQAGPKPAACRMDADLPAWCTAALHLLAISDEASEGIGFQNVSTIAKATRQWHWAGPTGAAAGTEEERRRRAATLCLLVPPEECCVQPKARTPQVGCNLRSLSLHLALLPALGHVTTRHLISPAPMTARQLNLLLVPYPYVVADDVLFEKDRCRAERWGRFDLRQSWLTPDWMTALPRFLVELCEEAREREGIEVNGVILPELSTEVSGLDIVAGHLAKQKGMELFVAGALDRGPRSARNVVRSYMFSRGKALPLQTQAKHHRWRIDPGQLDAYGLKLGGATPGIDWWWEAIDVANREVVSYVYHQRGGVFATFVCEDLARIDPVQPVVRAIGPNLLLALLMDGPQSVRRWPGRYAMGLCEDPGTSILTLTCAAMARRWKRGLVDPPPVALWKDMWSGPDPRELVLPTDHHAVVLCLEQDSVSERTLDRRSDDRSALAVKYARHVPLRHPAPPAWVQAVAPSVGGH